MKFAIILVLVIATATALPSQLRSLMNKTDMDAFRRDAAQIMKMVPVEAIKSIVNSYLTKGDPEILQIRDYIKSPKFDEGLGQLAEVPVMEELLSLLESTTLSQVAKFVLGYTTKPKPGLIGLYNEIVSIVPIRKIVQHVRKLVEKYPVMSSLVDKMSSTKYKQLAERVLEVPAISNLIKTASDIGLPVYVVMKEISKFLHWD